MLAVSLKLNSQYTRLYAALIRWDSESWYTDVVLRLNFHLRFPLPIKVTAGTKLSRKHGSLMVGS